MEDELIKKMEIFKIENRLEMLNKKLESSLPFEKCYISFEIIKLKEKRNKKANENNIWASNY
mgnify:FL=1|jgi:hypothetical protein